MSKDERLVTTDQIVELIALRRAGAPIKRAFSIMFRGIIEEAEFHEQDVLELVCWLISFEKSHGPQGERVREIIARLTSGGVAPASEDPRFTAGKTLWDRGFGREAKFQSFDDYLAGIPEIPESLVASDPEFPLLSLADQRLGLVVACRLIGITYEELGYSNASAAPFDDRHATPTEPFWFRHDDGRRNRDRRLDHCRRECMGSVYAMTAMVAVHAYLHHPGIIEQGVHSLDCPGSVNALHPSMCCSLRMMNSGKAVLNVNRHHFAEPDRGSGAFRLE